MIYVAQFSHYGCLITERDDKSMPRHYVDSGGWHYSDHSWFYYCSTSQKAKDALIKRIDREITPLLKEREKFI